MECFVVHRDEIEGRIDPFYYRPEFRNLQRELSKLKSKRLGEVIEFSSETWNQKDFFDKEFPYIEISEIDTSTGEIRNITYYEKSKAPSRAKMIVRENDIIVSTTRPHRGAISLIDKSKDGFIASTGFAILRNLKIREINKEYLLFFLRTKLALKQMLQRNSGGNYPAITPEELKKIIIPIPPLETQQKVISKIKQAYNLKKQKEAEAQQLLDSINNYVLSELGIKIPELKDQMTFSVYSDDVKGGRLDPYYYSSKHKALENCIKNSRYNTIKIKEIVISHNSGDWGIAEIEVTTNNFKKVKIVRNVNFNNDFNLSVENLPVRYIEKNRFSKYNLQKGDILLEKSGGSPDQPVGRVALVDFEHPENYFYSNFLERLVIDNKRCLSDYFFAVMKVLYKYKYTEKVQNQTTGIRNLILEQFFDLKIPLPPLSVQNKIAEEVKRRMQKAEQLQKEAKEILEKAKQEVENIILKGENNEG